MSTSANVSRSPNYRFWIPITLIVASTATLNYLSFIEHHMRLILVYPTLICTALLLGIWWVFFAGKFRWKSLLAGIGGTALLIALAANTLRYEGSANGALPANFTWKWTEKPGENLAPLQTPSTEDAPAIAETSDPDLADFPAFLGEAMDGFVPDPGLNPDWEANPPEELWRISIGLGWSAFSVVGERAVTQEQRGEEELVTCYHVKTGQLLWSHADSVRFSEPMGGDGPRATPTIRDGVVYALGATGILNALDLADGKLLWSRS
ncbi:MAG: PQQ-binding-like beta-propeller repeat protein, partial [Verrucomicrobiota bacterium]